jgi:uncharacterized repeat protein (TIGR01451 family)
MGLRAICIAALLVGVGLVLDPSPTAADLPVTQVSTIVISIPTFFYAGFLEMRHSDIYNMDYPWLDWSRYEASGPQPIPHNYTALVVENPWLRLTFLPELGGRLYGVTVKATGEELLYHNPVIMPTHWGPPEQGWWLAAGGIEWCLPVGEHGYESGVPWSYEVSTTAQGTAVTLWDTTASSRVRARIRVYLPADRAAFQITPRLENPTADPVALKFWDNAMLAPGAANTVGPELRFVVPTDQVTVHSRGDGYLPDAGQQMGWPWYGGTDYSRLGNWNKWLGFFARPQASADWAGVYDQAVLRGVARVFPHQVAQGVKGFAFGWQQPIDWHNWTYDPGGKGTYYAELHGGLAPTFWDAVTLNPGQVLEWTETWLPLQDLPYLSLATPELALGLNAAGDGLDVGLQVAGQRDDISLRLWRQADCTPLWRQDGLRLLPGETYTHHLPGLGLQPSQVVVGVLEGSDLLVLSGELTCPVPTSHVDPLDGVQTTPAFAVSWSADDAGGVAASYDIQVRDGDTSATWTGWLTNTAATSATFSGQNGRTYAFRSRVHDIFADVEPWPTDQWQDAFTTVLLQPAPVLITSVKMAQPLRVQPGDVVNFRIELNNTGSLAANVHLTDTLPANLMLTGEPWISSGVPAPVVVDHTILWSGSLAAGQTGVVLGFEAQVGELQLGTAITNLAWIDDGTHPALVRQATVTRWYKSYLPAILKRSTGE